MKLTAEMLRRVAGAGAKQQNINSLVECFDKYGERFGLTLPHRLAQFLAQVLHESCGLIYSKEIWGPTKTQKRYDTRKDLGNTPVYDGDGKEFKGHGLLQVTGRKNVSLFYKWCVAQKLNPPDFNRTPSLISTAPWSALCCFWYWDANRLNRYADRGDIEMITKSINGGLNGYNDRLQWYDRVSLDILGFKNIKALQQAADIMVDGLSGPRTRAAMHTMLLNLTPKKDMPKIVTAAPVVDVKIPKQLDKPLHKTSGFWERIASLGGLVGAGSATYSGDWRVVLVILIFLFCLVILGLFFQERIIKTIRDIKGQLS